LRVRETALEAVKTLINYFHSLFPPYATLLPFGRVYASLSLLGSKSATDESVKVFVSAWFTGGPVKLI
jgi:hypothetical protein